jgi:hypothetical protein
VHFDESAIEQMVLAFKHIAQIDLAKAVREKLKDPSFLAEDRIKWIESVESVEWVFNGTVFNGTTARTKEWVDYWTGHQHPYSIPYAVRVVQYMTAALLGEKTKYNTKLKDLFPTTQSATPPNLMQGSVDISDAQTIAAKKKDVFEKIRIAVAAIKEKDPEFVCETLDSLCSLLLNARQGQAEFRKKVMCNGECEQKCILTRCSYVKACEAAHIVPVARETELGEGKSLMSNNNGIFLRADLHRLYDANLLWFTTKKDVTTKKGVIICCVDEKLKALYDQYNGYNVTKYFNYEKARYFISKRNENIGL